MMNTALNSTHEVLLSEQCVCGCVCVGAADTLAAAELGGVLCGAQTKTAKVEYGLQLVSIQ